MNRSLTKSASAPREKQRRVSAERLIEFSVHALTVCGLSPQHARTAADVLVMTDTWGTFSHGTNHLRNYCKKIRAGGIDPNASPSIVRQNLSWSIIDGHGALGMVSASFAMKSAISKARTAGLGFATLLHGNHFGAAGYYANMAAREGMIGLAMSNADPNMTVPGGRGNTIGNNPFSYSIPNGNEPPVFLDIALSVVASSKVHAAKKHGKSIPPDWIVDAEGMSTTDPSGYPDSGSLVPVGGHKGYGLAFMLEILSGGLSGAALLGDIPSWLLNLPSRPNLGQAFFAIDVAAFVSPSDFSQRMHEAVRYLREAPKAKESNRIYLPGEIEWERRAEALAHGIPLPANVIEELHLLSVDLGIDPSTLYI